MIKDRISREEIEKWLVKIKKDLKDIKAKEETGEKFLENINAYVKDCEHWLKEGDYVKAWEVVSFAWGLLEAGIELNELKS
jgi:hypothetical protein